MKGLGSQTDSAWISVRPGAKYSSGWVSSVTSPQLLRKTAARISRIRAANPTTSGSSVRPGGGAASATRASARSLTRMDHVDRAGLARCPDEPVAPCELQDRPDRQQRDRRTKDHG